MASWKLPPIIKIYEALGCLADNRIEILSPHLAKVYASDHSKFYTVYYDPPQILSNDNGSYWKGYLGYPPIAFLIKTGLIPSSLAVQKLLQSIPWKKLNLKFKYDYDQVINFIHQQLKNQGQDPTLLITTAHSILKHLRSLQLQTYPYRLRPPKDLTDSQKLFDQLTRKLNLRP